jgi:poly-gamma-glutamate capsule biosynthesis protein CapA/YwtB (metallophosphatase superfamily)
VDFFLCGDVMTGRGIDQVLPHPSDPRIYEPFARSALSYVALAESANGPIPRPVDFTYVWGDALAEIDARAPDFRLVNLETSVTTSADAAPKGINYRMHPANVPCLQTARIDCCALANNHVLDWGSAGLLETIEALSRAGIATAGAGATKTDATRPAALTLPGGRGRALVFSFGCPDSGVPEEWAATEARPGVNLLSPSPAAAAAVGSLVGAAAAPGDRVVVSVHWGPNWGYGVEPSHRDFAHRLIDSGLVDVVWGHSSHHLRGLEVYRGRLIIYGCGDFINDYEGISGHEAYRPDLAVAYFVSVDDRSGSLSEVNMAVFRRRRFRLERVGREDAGWVREVLDREGKRLGTSARVVSPNLVRLRWS